MYISVTTKCNRLILSAWNLRLAGMGKNSELQNNMLYTNYPSGKRKYNMIRFTCSKIHAVIDGLLN